MATTAIIVGMVVAAAVAAGGAAYGVHQQQEQAKQAAKMAEFQEEQERAQGEAARRQVRMKAQRMLNSQASKAGAAGVVAGEGSLLTNQVEAASLAKYEEDLAAFGHELSGNANNYRARLFKANAPGSLDMALSATLAAGSSVASSLSNMPKGGTTVATNSSLSGGTYGGGLYGDYSGAY